MDSNTVRILSLDGGGVRGYLSLKWLQRFIGQWGINSNELWKYFDVIAGTSIGGIQALGYAYGKSPDELESFFLEKAKRIFTTRTYTEWLTNNHHASTDSLRLGNSSKVGLIANDEPFYKSPYNDSNYGHNILHQVLVDNFGESKLNNLKIKVVIPAYERIQKKYVIFSNYENPNFQGRNNKIVDIARATSAAPVYLPSHKFMDKYGIEREYVDGGIYQNNPAEIALSLGKAFKPFANRYCVLSLGTGIGDMGFDGPDEDPDPLKPDDPEPSFRSDNKLATNPSSPPSAITSDGVAKIFELFDISSTGGQESIDYNLRVRANGTLEPLYYYRFQPKLDKNQNTELDNSDVSFLNYMKTTANTHYDNDTNNINNFIGHLTA